MLAISDFYANFVIEIDANDGTGSAVLIQYNLTVAFTLKVLNSAQPNYHTTYCELLIIVFVWKR